MIASVCVGGEFGNLLSFLEFKCSEMSMNTYIWYISTKLLYVLPTYMNTPAPMSFYDDLHVLVCSMLCSVQNQYHALLPALSTTLICPTLHDSLLQLSFVHLSSRWWLHINFVKVANALQHSHHYCWLGAHHSNMMLLMIPTNPNMEILDHMLLAPAYRGTVMKTWYSPTERVVIVEVCRKYLQER